MEKSYQQNEITIPRVSNSYHFVLAAALYLASGQKATVRKLKNDEKEVATTNQPEYKKVAYEICPRIGFCVSTNIFEPCVERSTDPHETVCKIASALLKDNLCVI